MIHYSKIGGLMERKGADRRRVPFSLSFVKLSTGEVISGEDVVCTSSFNGGKTVNIMFLTSMEVRKIRLILVIKFNGQDVFI